MSLNVRVKLVASENNYVYPSSISPFQSVKGGSNCCTESRVVKEALYPMNKTVPVKETEKIKNFLARGGGADLDPNFIKLRPKVAYEIDRKACAYFDAKLVMLLGLARQLETTPTVAAEHKIAIHSSN